LLTTNRWRANLFGGCSKSIFGEIVAECRNGKEAVTSILELKPRLVFLDVQMPEMDGFTTLETLGAATLPQIIFVTAYEQYAIRALRFMRSIIC
jgi:DNA-binding LytR/AlgR family response regulator